MINAQIAVEADTILAVDAHIIGEPVLDVATNQLNTNDATEDEEI